MTWGFVAIFSSPLSAGCLYQPASAPSGRFIDREGWFVQRRRRDIARPLLGLFVDDPRQLGMTGQQFVEIDDVERQERTGLRRDDGGVARRAGQQCDFPEKLARPEIQLLRLQPYLDFPVDDEIHAVAGLA